MFKNLEMSSPDPPLPKKSILSIITSPTSIACPHRSRIIALEDCCDDDEEPGPTTNASACL